MKPFRFQKKGVWAIEDHNGRVLLGDEMGLGKTPQSLWCLKRNPDWLPAIVVCPASVKYVWEDEARKVCNWRSAVLEGQTPAKPGRFKSLSKLTIINYDILRFWVKRLVELKPKTIIIDECQYISNPQTRRTKAVKELSKGIPRILALSGTPLLNRPIELFPVLNILWPKVFPARRVYGDDYCGPEWTPWGINYKGATNTKKLNRLLLNAGMIRRRKVDVLDQLPNKMRQVIPIHIKNWHEYQRANEDFLNWLRATDPAAAVRASKAVSLSKINYLLQLAARLKLRPVVNWIDEFLLNSPGEKIVVGATHKKMIRALKRRITEWSLVIDGSVLPQKRRQVVDQFQNDDRYRVLLGNIQAAGVGITLTAASTVVVVELPWRPGDLVQFEDRCHRIGANKPVWCYYLVARGTIEEKLCKIQQSKQKVLSAVLDGGPADGDLDIFNRLCSELKGEL